MTQRASIAALLHDLDQRSPAGFAIALHIRFTTPTYLFQTYPKRWLDHYSSAGLVVHDPVVRWGFQQRRAHPVDRPRGDRQQGRAGASEGLRDHERRGHRRGHVRVAQHREASRAPTGTTTRSRSTELEARLARLHRRDDRPRPAQRERSAGADGAVDQAHALIRHRPAAGPVSRFRRPGPGRSRSSRRPGRRPRRRRAAGRRR